MIKRYTIRTSRSQAASLDIIEASDGKWVKYDDMKADIEQLFMAARPLISFAISQTGMEIKDAELWWKANRALRDWDDLRGDIGAYVPRPQQDLDNWEDEGGS